MNTYIFPLAILLAKRKRLALAPLYLRSLFFNPDYYIKNIIQSIGCYHVVTHADTTFLQVILWNGSGCCPSSALSSMRLRW